MKKLRLQSSMFRVFEPSSIAIIGASPTPGKIGNMVLRNILSSGYKGKIYPVNPRHSQVMGLRSYKSVLDINDEVDLCIISVPARIVPRVLEDCGKAHIAGAVIFSSGFSEYSEEGRRLEELVRDIGKKYGVRLIGPNCMGFFNAEINLNATFSPGITPKLIERGRKGYAAFISQSGALSTAVLLEAAALGVYFNKFFTLGNKVDVDEADILLYLSEKDEIKAISIYMEGLREGKGRKFLDVAKSVSERKPIVVLKTGKTSTGSRAARSHTGSLAGMYTIYQAVFRQTNIIEAYTLREMLYFMKFAKIKYPIKGTRVAIISGSGGAAVLASDMLEFNGIKVKPLPDIARKELLEILSVPVYASINNPMDLTFEGMTGENFVKSIEYLASRDLADVFLVCLIGSRALEVVDSLIRVYERVKKPVIVVWTGKIDESVLEKAQFLDSKGIPVFDFPGETGMYLAKFLSYVRKRRCYS